MWVWRHCVLMVRQTRTVSIHWIIPFNWFQYKKNNHNLHNPSEVKYMAAMHSNVRGRRKNTAHHISVVHVWHHPVKFYRSSDVHTRVLVCKISTEALVSVAGSGKLTGHGPESTRRPQSIFYLKTRCYHLLFRDARMTPHEPYGDTLCSSSVVFLMF